MNSTVEAKPEKTPCPLNQIYFYLTEGCNLKCRHCWIQPRFQGDGKAGPALDAGLFRSILDQAKPLGLSGVKLTGGEPLIHPDIARLLEDIRDRELGLTLETNGVAVTPQLAQKIKACGNPFVSVSLDGESSEIHEWVRGVPGCHGKAVSGIRCLVDNGINPQVIMTLMERNREEMEPLVMWAKSLGAGSVKFNVLQPTARGERMHDTGEALSIRTLVELGRWVETELAGKAGIPLYFGHPPAFRPLSRIFDETGDGCGICGIFGILGVLANGSYALCGIGETVPELVFGEADRDPLKDVWEKNPILKAIREGIPGRLEGVCGKCVMKARCLGSCIAQNYYRSRDLWAPFWFCEAALIEGLFPETRLIPT